MKKKKEKNKDREKKIKSPAKPAKLAIDAATEDHVKRLNRVLGQVDGVRKMLLEGRKYADVLAQCKAIHSALRSVEIKLMKERLEDAIEDIAHTDKRKDREKRIDALLELFKPVG